VCMLFGFNANRRFEVKNVLRNFFEYSCVHPDGWGLCTYWNKGLEPGIIKEAVPAYKSYMLMRMLEESVAGKTVIAHIRKKTFGQVSMKNTHPFKMAEWVLAHNGSVNIPEKYINGGDYRAAGETDSERILCYIMNNLQEQQDSQNSNFINIIEKSILKLSNWGKLNLLLTNGDMMFVHSNVRETLYYAYVATGAVTFCTKPILSSLDWQEVPNNKVLVFRDGALVYEGKTKIDNYDLPWSRYSDDWIKCFS